jgi:hypothetical protein
LIVGVMLHTASSSFPSIDGADSARTAVALVSVGAGTAAALAGFVSPRWEGACATTWRLSARPRKDRAEAIIRLHAEKVMSAADPLLTDYRVITFERSLTKELMLKIQH